MKEEKDIVCSLHYFPQSLTLWLLMPLIVVQKSLKELADASLPVSTCAGVYLWSNKPGEKVDLRNERGARCSKMPLHECYLCARHKYLTVGPSLLVHFWPHSAAVVGGEGVCVTEQSNLWKLSPSAPSSPAQLRNNLYLWNSHFVIVFEKSEYRTRISK